ncbi:FlaA1/EpsC-like NDP-sugar epimerase [Dysgonomonadaceae bacterium PH5-43]|nr:FlaA1/EpsC-like NDP-sugar epimerase [Dysgonomonadaceae bacterium PH5-43]
MINTAKKTVRVFPYLPRWAVLFIDVIISIFAFTIAYLVYYQIQKRTIDVGPYMTALFVNTGVNIIFFLALKTYVGVMRYSTLRDAWRIFGATLGAFVSMIVVANVLSAWWSYETLSAGFLFINFLFVSTLMVLFRMIVKLTYDYICRYNSLEKLKPILVFDVTPSTIAIAELIKNTQRPKYELMGFITPDEKDNKNSILNLPLYSMSKKDALKIKKKGVEALLINPKEQGRREKQAISDYCEENNLKILSMATLSSIDDEGDAINKIKDIQIEDLLGRVPIDISVDKIASDLEGKCVMVTGAAGSIGSEIVRQIANFNPGLLLLCDIAESPLHTLQLEIKERFPNIEFLPLICDVRNYNRMAMIFEKYKPAHIYHAAAYKHVPLMEDHPCEAVYSNVFGTKNTVDLAYKYGAEAFVMISTDKAVNPTNVMGASKRIAEIYVQTLYKEICKDKTNDKFRIITTRFGNVLGSNGSVIPRFKEQIEKGGPITVTDERIIRYFMTIREACRLVLEAANMGKGGEIFVFDMGTPVKIVDLARKMIKLSGLKPDKDIKIVYTGLRPGEKLYEELLATEESTKPTYNKKIMIGTVRDDYEYCDVTNRINELAASISNYENEHTVELMKQLVPEFVSENSIYEKLDKKHKEALV